LRLPLARKFASGRRLIRGLRAYDPKRRRSRLPGPTSIQIQTTDRCNAACAMCPYSSRVRTGPANEMPDALFTRILEGLRETGAIRSICLMLQNEPLLDRRLHERVRQIRRLLPGVFVTTVTNASLLTPDRADELLASGLDHISVSIDAATEASYAQIRKGLDFAKVVRHTEALLQRTGGRRVNVKFLRQRANQGEERAFARRWRPLGATVTFEPLTNRAGTLDGFERMRAGRRGLLRAAATGVLNRVYPRCPLPFARMAVLWDGRVILCCHDWEPRDVLGDLSTQSVAEVWNGEPMNRYRHLLWTKRPSESLICRDCSLAKRFWNL